MTFKPHENPAMTVALTEPIQFMGENITELRLRTPTPRDLLDIGDPVRHDVRDASINFDQQRAFAMITRLSGVPFAGSLDGMSTNDAMSLFWALVPFFVAGMRAAPRNSSSSSQNTKTPEASSTKLDAPPAA